MSDRSSSTLHRRSPFAGLALPGGEGLAVIPAPEATRLILRGDPATVAAFGLPVPERLKATTTGARAALWLGPDETLLLAPGEDAAALQSVSISGPHSLVDVSHRQTGLVLTGRLAALCLSSGCPLDLRLTAFPVGMATRTLFHKAEIILWRQAEERFHIEVWRSFAPYLAGHLAEACAGTTGL